MLQKDNRIQQVNKYFKDILTSDISGLTTDYIELAIDNKITDEILKEIPVVKTFLGALNISRATYDLIFARNILLFINGVKDIDPERRKVMVKKIDGDESFGVKCGEFFIQLLKKIDSTNKTLLISYIFKKYLQDEINRDTMFRMIKTVERLFWFDLTRFASEELGSIENKDRYLFDLINSEGLITQSQVGTMAGFTGGPVRGQLNMLGNTLKETTIEFLKKYH